MVTAQTQYSLGNARSYFTEHLAVGDYYAEGQIVTGEWFGTGAERLGLSGRIRESEFLRLCENEHPSTADPLTARLNTVRTSEGGTTANRRIFYDFTFSPPKSVSIAALVEVDDRILAAHARAVQAALSEFEAFAATRVRTGGADINRSTGNLVTALFTHETSRALDPHLHTHAIVFNATWDPIENRWKALQKQDFLGAKKFAENILSTGHRPLAVDVAGAVRPPRIVPPRWRRLHGQFMRFGTLAVARLGIIHFLRPKHRIPGARHEKQRTRKLGV